MSNAKGQPPTPLCVLTPSCFTRGPSLHPWPHNAGLSTKHIAQHCVGGSSPRGKSLPSNQENNIITWKDLNTKYPIHQNTAISGLRPRDCGFCEPQHPFVTCMSLRPRFRGDFSSGKSCLAKNEPPTVLIGTHLAVPLPPTLQIISLQSRSHTLGTASWPS